MKKCWCLVCWWKHAEDSAWDLFKRKERNIIHFFLNKDVGLQLEFHYLPSRLVRLKGNEISLFSVFIFHSRLCWILKLWQLWGCIISIDFVSCLLLISAARMPHAAYCMVIRSGSRNGRDSNANIGFVKGPKTGSFSSLKMRMWQWMRRGQTAILRLFYYHIDWAYCFFNLLLQHISPAVFVSHCTRQRPVPSFIPKVLVLLQKIDFID